MSFDLGLKGRRALVGSRLHAGYPRDRIAQNLLGWRAVRRSRWDGLFFGRTVMASAQHRPLSRLLCEIVDQRADLTVVSTNNAGEFRAELECEPNATHPHVTDLSGRNAPQHPRSPIERCLDLIAGAGFDRQIRRISERTGIVGEDPAHIAVSIRHIPASLSCRQCIPVLTESEYRNGVYIGIASQRGCKRRR